MPGSETVEQARGDAGGANIVKVDPGVCRGVAGAQECRERRNAKQLVPEEGGIDGHVAAVGTLAKQQVGLVIVPLAQIEVADK